MVSTGLCGSGWKPTYSESLRRLSWIEDPRGSPGNQQFISRRCALTSAQSVQSMNGCLGIRRESCKIEWCDAAGLIEQGSAVPEWEQVYEKEAQERRLLYQAR